MKYPEHQIANPDLSLPAERPEGAPVDEGSFWGEEEELLYRKWEPMIRSEYFADVIHGLNEYHVLKVKGELYLFAGDIARHTERTVLEILELCGHGNAIYYPAPGIPHPLSNAVPGAYVPITSGLRLIPRECELRYDRYEIADFRDAFARRMQEG